MDPLHRSEIHGETDSEHVFRYLLSLFLQHPEAGLYDTVRRGLDQVVAWCAEAAPEKKIGLNIILTDGDTLVGSRLNRSLYHLRRDHLHVCMICGKTHVHHDAKQAYRAIEVASEPVTFDEVWAEVPNGVVYLVTPEIELELQPLSVEA